MSLEFNKSKGYTLGIEVEVQLLDESSLSLSPASPKILKGLQSQSASIKHELMLSNIEVNTKVCSDLAEAEEDLFEKFLLLSKEAGKEATLLSLAGSHPFSSWRDQKITDDARYLRIVESLGIIARRFNIFGLHVHVGIDGGEKCIYVLNRLLYFLPHILALSANSPFWEGEDTNLRSHRIKIFESLPHAGLPFYLADWSDYLEIVENYLRTDTIETIREVWWDVRPHNDFGTLEVRICDTPSSLSEVLAIAALVQALVAKLGREFDEGVKFSRPHSSVIRENKWRACRYGLDGRFILADGKDTIDTKEAIRGLIASVEEEGREFGSSGYLASIEDILEKGDGASRQLKVWKETGDLESVVRFQSETFSDELRAYFLSEG